MLTYTARCIDPVHGEYAAGYEQPSTGMFVPMVAGCPSHQVALGEAERLNAEARERQVGAFVEHNLRAPSAEWYRDE